MDDLLELTKKYEKELDKTFMDIVIDLVRYLRKYKYLISPSCVIDFFNMTSSFDILNLEDFYGISKTLFCKNIIQSTSYEDLFYKFIRKYVTSNVEDLIKLEKEKQKNEIKSLKDKLQTERLEIANKATEEKKKIINNIVSDKMLTVKQQKKQFENLNNESSGKLDNILKKINKEYLKDFLALDIEGVSSYIKFEDEFPVNKFKKDLNDLMMENLQDENFDEDLNELLVKTSKSLSKISDSYKKESNAIQKKVIEKESENQREINMTIKEQHEHIGEIVKKFGTKNHRNGEFKGKNAIQDLLNIKDKQINKLNEKEYTSLIDYIKLNASKFRTVISRSMRQSKNKVFDYKATMANSIKYYGEPMKLYYKKPIIKKYKLICIMDISGSVSKYLKLLTSFLYEINAVFNGGVHIFGFVSDLIDFTEVFNKESLDIAVENTKGHRGYSSYYKALSDFNDDYLKIVDKNTIVIFFGDARNNKNNDGLDYLNAIKERCKSIVWLNPETKEKWNNGDSIIGKYEQCIDQLHEILEVDDLVKFMENFSLNKSVNI